MLIIRDILQAQRWYNEFKDMDQAERDQRYDRMRDILKPLGKPKLRLYDLDIARTGATIWCIADAQPYKTYTNHRQSVAYRNHEMTEILFWSQEFVLTFSSSSQEFHKNTIVSWDKIIDSTRIGC